MENPNPKKYVIKFRKGEPILVDRQIGRWRKYRKPAHFASYYKRKRKDGLGEDLLQAVAPKTSLDAPSPDSKAPTDGLGLQALLGRDSS